MSTEKKRRKIMRLKGSVLFTTLVVMILILLIMLSAIGLAGMASKRAYSTWYDNQTKYTAQDLVDNVIETLGPSGSNKALGGQIVGKLQHKGDKVDLEVKVGGNSTIPGYGEVQKLTFENAGTNKGNFTISGLTGHDNEAIIKVSAQVSMGGEISTYSTYVVGQALNNRADGNGGGYIALADLKGGSGSNDAPLTIGRFYAGIDDKIDKTAGGNQTINAGDIFINTDEYHFNAKKNDPAGIILGRNDPVNGYYGGMRVTGNMTLQNGLLIQSQYPPSYITDMSSENFYNIPYLYIDGEFSASSDEISCVDYNGRPGLLNLYCNNFNFGNNIKLSGNMNIMTMGEGVDNTLKLESSKLTDWASATVSGVTNKGNFESGNFYCKGNFNKSGNDYEIDGDLCVVGNLNVSSGKITVHNGDVYVGGSVSGTVEVDAGRKIKDGLGTSTATYLQNLKNLDNAKEADGVTKTYPNATVAASRFETAYKLKDGTTDYVQTLDNVKKQFKDTADPTKYMNVVETSKYTGTDKLNGVGPITTSCIWDNTTCLNGDTKKKLSDGVDGTILINPGANELWINIAPSLNCINQKTIIVDDSAGGSVRFFIEKGSGSRTLELTQTKIITKTYRDMLYKNDKEAKDEGSSFNVTLSTYPEAKYVPQIYMYAASDNNVTIKMQNGGYMFTGDIIAPKATFDAQSTNGVKPNVKYTKFNYVDMDGNGTVDPGEMANPVTIDRKMDLCYIGSLEVGTINVNNQFGYLYVDDPPTGSTPPSLATGFSWTQIDGYSTY